MIKSLIKQYKILAALIMGCFFVCSCENDIQQVENLGKKANAVDEAKQIESFLSLDGKMKARLTAPLMLRYHDTLTEFPKTLHVDFYNDSLKVESELSAKYGRFRESEHVVFLKDSVVVFNISHDTLFCKELNWDQQKAIFYTDKNVIIHKSTQKIYGTGLIAQQDFKSFTIKQVHDSYMNIPDSSFIAQ